MLRFWTPIPVLNTSWTPLSEGANCKLWMDPTDNTKITYTSSNIVNTWLDKSSNNYTFTANSNEVVTTPSGINGLQVINLDQGTGDSGLIGPANKFVSTTSPWTIAFVVKINTYTNGSQTTFLFSNGSSSDIYYVGLQSSAETGYVGLNFASSTSSEFLQGLYNHTFSTGTSFAAVISYSGSNPTSTSSYQVWINGVSQTVTTSPGGFSAASQAGTSIGAAFGSAYAGYVGTWYSGDLMFFSEQNSTLTSNINTFLSNKWAL
jgi:hypothetical protein